MSSLGFILFKSVNHRKGDHFPGEEEGKKKTQNNVPVFHHRPQEGSSIQRPAALNCFVVKAFPAPTLIHAKSHKTFWQKRRPS